jgi:hypothetical protein
MSKLFLRSALILCIGSWSGSAFAQQVSLTMNNGRVTLKATNATVRQILDEWARVGGTKVVNADKLAGQPVTLTLVDEPEGQALETVLRSAAGYMVSERTNPAPNGSRFERIMLMGRTTPVAATASASNQNAYTANGPTPPGGSFQAEGPVNADDDGDPPQPTAPVVNPYAQAGAPGAVAGSNANGVPGMGTGLGQQQAAAAGVAGQQQPQQNVQPNPGYSNVYGQGNAATGVGTPGSATGTGTISTSGSQPETKFDYANPQKYFQQRGQQGSQQGTAMQPYPGVPMSPTATGTGTGTGTATGATPGTGAPGTITTPQQVPNNQNPYSPNFNPYNLPAGGGVPSTTPGTATATPVEPDRAKYANPYMQPGTQQPQQPQQQP